MNKFVIVKKASNEIITTYLKRVNIDDSILKSYIKDPNVIDYTIWFDPKGSYIKWQLHIIDNGIGQALINVDISDLVIQGKLQYELEDESQKEIDITIPVNKDKIKVDFNMTSNIIEVSYIDYYNNEINVVFGSVEE